MGEEIGGLLYTLLGGFAHYTLLIVSLIVILLLDHRCASLPQSPLTQTLHSLIINSNSTVAHMLKEQGHLSLEQKGAM